MIQLHGEPVFDEGIDECNPGQLSRRLRDAALGEALGERGDVRFAISCGELDFSDSRHSGAKLLRNCDGTVHVATTAPDLAVITRGMTGNGAVAGSQAAARPRCRVCRRIRYGPASRADARNGAGREAAHTALRSASIQFAGTAVWCSRMLQLRGRL